MLQVAAVDNAKGSEIYFLRSGGYSSANSVPQLGSACLLPPPSSYSDGNKKDKNKAATWLNDEI